MCLYVPFADLPEPVKNCTAYNATANSLQIQCIPGYDGGIPQHFHAQIYDELTRQILYNASYKYPEFTVKRLPSDSAFNIRVTAVNAQGPSKVAYRVRGRTLSAPLLRTGRSSPIPPLPPLTKLPQNGVESFYQFLISDFALCFCLLSLPLSSLSSLSCAVQPPRQRCWYN